MPVSNSSQLNQACRVLENGGVIICPTDTIPGLSCLPTQTAALQKILAIKKRPVDKGLILIANQLSFVEPYIEPVSTKHQERINNSNTPTTWLAKARNTVNQMITGKHSTLAFRICDHDVVSHLCEALQQPLVSTSANIHGQTTVSSNEEISAQVIDQVDVVLSGAVGTKKASIIRRLDDDKVIRS